MTSTPVGGQRSPRLLWAVSHATLVRSDVPMLQAGGFDVVAEEPDPAVLREHDFVTYPNLGDAPETSEVGQRLRLWARDGCVTPAEAKSVNASFDAVMVATRLDVALNVSRWFDGVVLFRYFGNVPAVPDAARLPHDRSLLNRVVGVPIFSSLLDTDVMRAAAGSVLMRTLVPAPKVPASVHIGEGEAIGLYMAGLDDNADIQEWTKALAASLADREVLVFGVASSRRERYERLGPNVRSVPRLAGDEYWSTFADLSLMVYPHNDPEHSHFIPLEAITLGIPCLVHADGAIARESADPASQPVGVTSDEPLGVFASLAAMAAAAVELSTSPGARTELAKQQRALLTPFSESTVLAQAQTLSSEVAQRVDLSNPKEPALTSSGIPTSSPLRAALLAGVPTSVEVAPATIGASSTLDSSWSAAVVSRSEPGDLGALHIRPGDDLLLKLGELTGLDGPALMKVELEAETDTPIAAVVEVSTGDDEPDRFLFGSGRPKTWEVTVPVKPLQAVRVRVHTALTVPTTLRSLSLTRVTSEVEPALPVGAALSRRGAVPLHALGQTAPVLGRFSSRLTAALEPGWQIGVDGARASPRCHAIVMRRSRERLPRPDRVMILGRSIRWPSRWQRPSTVVAVGNTGGIAALTVSEGSAR